jgi:class 3 adenylate cyclase
VNLGGELRDVTILVSDLRGFTALAASLPPHVVVVIINRYLEKMVDIIMQYGGTIDEFTGDGVLAFFGAPRRLTDSALRAVNCAIEMQRAMPLLNREIRTDTAALLSDAAAHADNRTAGAYELPELTMGIAISRGPVIVGNIGCERRKKYGAVGTPINMAFRLESKCPGGEILLTEEAYERVSHAVQAESRPGTRLKGIATPVTVYHVGFN